MMFDKKLEEKMLRRIAVDKAARVAGDSDVHRGARGVMVKQEARLVLLNIKFLLRSGRQGRYLLAAPPFAHAVF
jgi:hypothetical protein